jgi:hypothetical protein
MKKVLILLMFVFSFSLFANTNFEILSVNFKFFVTDICGLFAMDFVNAFENEYGCLNAEDYNYLYNGAYAHCQSMNHY